MEFLRFSHIFLGITEYPQISFTFKYLQTFYRRNIRYQFQMFLRWISLKGNEKVGSTFLFRGFALNFGILSSSSCSISNELFTLGGRALNDVCSTGVLGSVRWWDFPWLFYDAMEKKSSIGLARTKSGNIKYGSIYTWRDTSVEATEAVSAFWFALAIVSKWNSCIN